VSPALRVVACGSGATLQDAGRFGLQRHGVSPAGAMDSVALARANALVGNPLTAAGVELTLAGASFAVEGGPVLVAVEGGGAALAVGGRAVPPSTSALAAPGDVVTIGPCRGGVYACLAVGGGFDLPPEFGSLSLHRRSGIGAPPLAPGTVLPIGASAAPTPRRLPPEPAVEGSFRIMAGPQDDWFGPDAMALLTSAAFGVGMASDRMGVRLEGAILVHARGFNIVSDGIVAGAIQVPGDGRPIVLMRDRQTTGGYPKIATVITADLPRFAQLSPGAEARFRLVGRDEAATAAREMRRRIAGFAAAAAPAIVRPTTEALLAANLIDGVVAG
jgi:5-oxoprolinase (ATP-hydrolysing) subunit C